MNILLAAATAKEITPFLAYYRKTKALDVDILITGIGLTATTFRLTRHFCLNRPALVIQAGVAGCFDEQIPLGSVVLVKQDAIADQSVMEKGALLNMPELGLSSANEFPYKESWLINNHPLLRKSKLEKVRAVSVNHITTSPPMIGLYRKKWRPAIESMEGAALHYCCLAESIPFLQLRGISNYIGERNKKNWQLKEAVTNLNKELIRLVRDL